MKLFTDFETTGTNCMCDEIITGYFLSETGSEYLLESQVDSWSADAAEIHKIKYEDMMRMPYKRTAWDSLCDWLPTTFTLICYANPKTMLGHMYFDFAIFKMHLLNHFNLDRENHLPFNINCYSVYDLAKECHNEGLFETHKNPKTNRYSFKQTAVYQALFGSVYNAHDAKADVHAMVEIYNKLTELKETGKSIANSGQMDLL